MHDWQQPIDPRCFHRLRLEAYLDHGFNYNSYQVDESTGERYHVKRYRHNRIKRARGEDLGLTLCRYYGALTPGHLLFWDEDRENPILVQRAIPYDRTIGDLFREHSENKKDFPNTEKQAHLLETLSTRQVTEIMVCFLMDYLTYNFDPNPNNFLFLDKEDLLVGIDKGLTGVQTGDPNFILETPLIGEDSMVRYIPRLAKPKDTGFGSVYESVLTNIYRKKYSPDRNHLRSIINNVEQSGTLHDEQIRTVLDTWGLDVFISRRKSLYSDMSKLFSVLGVAL